MSTQPIAPLSPYLTVDDGQAAIDFYQRAFGAELHEKKLAPDGKRLIHASLSINGGLLLLSDDFPEFSGGRARTPRAFGGSAVTLHLDLPDVDSAFQRAVAAGATVTMPLADQFWGDRYGKLRDPFGHEWSLATRKRTASEAELREGAKQHFGGQ
jgi:PhnB protein